MINEVRVIAETVENDWVTFPGGELEGRRPNALCGPCRLRKAAGAPPRAICFHCYRADRLRQQGFQAAARFEAASAARFQDGLPFEPIDIPRLERLKFEREDARRQARAGAGQYVDKRRQAQIAARHALQRLGDGLKAHGMHAAELQLPESWLPFVASL